MSDDRIRVNCPACQSQLAIPAAAVGRNVRCPKCQEKFHVDAPPEPPAPAPTESLDFDALAGLASGTAVESADERRARVEAASAARPAPVVELPPTAPAAPKARFAWGTFFVNFFGLFLQRRLSARLLFLPIVFGGAGIFLGVKEFQLRNEASERPQTLSCAELQKQGFGHNRHVVLTDFVMLPDYVYETKRFGWDGAWVPVVPHELFLRRLAMELKVEPDQLSTTDPKERVHAMAKLTSQDFVVTTFLRFPKARDEAYMDEQYDNETLEGTVWPDPLGRLNRDQVTFLKNAYSTTDWKKCAVILVGRTPFSAAYAGGMVFGGGALLLLGLGIAGVIAARATS